MEELPMIKKRLTDTPRTDISDAYKIHHDRGLIYNPLSRYADKEKYKNAPKYEGRLETRTGNAIEFSVPTEVTAYDMVPVEYSFVNPVDVTHDQLNHCEPVHILATALESAERKKGKEFYSNILPGKIKVDFEFLGFVTGED